MNKTAKRIVLTVVYLILVIVITVFMIFRVRNITYDDNMSRMKELTRERSAIINNYIESAEDMLMAYGSSKEVEELLKDPSNPEKIASAQAYTDKISDVIDDIEGIYISQWDNHVLVHTNPEYIGMTTRTGEALERLRNNLINIGQDVYNAGIILSPLTGEQVLSMYKAVYDESENPIGIVGLGVFISNVENKLSFLPLNTENSGFSMLNVSDKKYIICEDKGKIGKSTENQRAAEICERFANSESSDVSYDFNENGKISLYTYISKYNWLMIIESPEDEVLEHASLINFNFMIYCFFVISWVIVYNVFSIRRFKAAENLEKSKKKQEAIKNNLHIAAFTDILTGINNRVRFFDDFSRDSNGNYKIADCPNNPYCFAMFNIANFSRINIMNGHDIGDALLVSTADILKDNFRNSNVYRTGSDEFVVAFQNSSPEGVNDFIIKVNNILEELQKPRQILNKNMRVEYSAAIVKKSKSISPVVLITLKDVINSNGICIDNNAVFVDMDTF